MQQICPSLFKAGVLCSLLVLAGASPALSQSSAGGSIGNSEKSISGTRSAPAVAPPKRAAPARSSEQPRRSSSGRGGGGQGGNYDGAWIVVSIGCGGSSTTAVVVSSGKIIGQGVTGTVSPSGATSATTVTNGITSVSSGRVSGRTGSGTFRNSNGCAGRWTSVKQ